MATIYDRPPRAAAPENPTRSQGPAPQPPPQAHPGEAKQESVGDLIGEITQDLTALVRDEINLAKAELKEEATKAGKAGGMLAGAGYAGHLLVVFAGLTVMFALAHAIDIAWAALIVTALWGAAAAVLYTTGRKRLKDVHLKPEQTVETLKEDAQWARHPTS
ncbi:phage holin family protein [Streptomyces sp. NRRL S-350]|uniref:phage holin family protein n=1 Tax=Streptomyces sp. NRRL S-350 TaxID=1463902 RepID=UPI00056A0438|nr:phage holin family protein [Streptomyces sp. NRRL S-350]